MQIQKIPHAKGIVTVPGDKSISHRSIMLASLASGTSEIRGFLKGADCLSTIDCFRRLGVCIEEKGDAIVVHGNGLYGLKQPDDTLYTGNSGTTTRLLCGILAAQKFGCTITGDESIQKRPMKRVTLPLSQMGAQIEGEYCPLHIHGTSLHGITYDMPVASAQVKTAILLAGLYADGATVINETDRSRDHTERMLAAMGADIRTDGLQVCISTANSLSPQKIDVAGDISSAAFFLVLGAILPGSELTLQNVNINETRTGILDVMQEMGAKLKIEHIRVHSGEPMADITVSHSSLKAVTIGGSLIPRLIDEIPAISVLALFAKGSTVIRDAQELKVKETNRIRAVVDEWTKCGARVTETEDGMVIEGGNPLHSADFLSYGDHRMAMSEAVLAQCVDGVSSIDDCKCVDISYPGFFDTLYALGR
jgi:3-phosphoshikimate 1-carboxyvinyltransferase